MRQKRNMETNAKIVNEVEEVSLDLKVVFGHSCETKDNLCSSSSSFPVMFRCFLMISLPVCVVSCDRLCLMHLWLNLFISHFLSLQFKGILSLHFDRWSSFSVRISWQQHSNLEHSVQAVHEDCFNERYTKSVTPSVSLSLSWLCLDDLVYIMLLFLALFYPQVLLDAWQSFPSRLKSWRTRLWKTLLPHFLCLKHSVVHSRLEVIVCLTSCSDTTETLFCRKR